ncbi:hypothetical protein [Candidatus Poriferisocius sp.]|uniref:hypothetical protein n=1 Tax=Candidatus Poriferisocius sp. TaxID=3101276 RepID=UPI003B015F4D
MSKTRRTESRSDDAMSAIIEIQRAILVLPEVEFAQLREWVSELDWEKWDKQIQADSDEGALDFLIHEAPYPVADPHKHPSPRFNAKSP